MGELGFARWKRPLLEAFRREIMDHGLLPACRESFHTYWTPLVMNTGSETVEDEEESVFFTQFREEEGLRQPRSSQAAAVAATHSCTFCMFIDMVVVRVSLCRNQCEMTLVSGLATARCEAGLPARLNLNTELITIFCHLISHR
jgi:hypothetical protein